MPIGATRMSAICMAYVTFIQQQIDGFISKRSPISYLMTITDRLQSLLSAIDALRCDFTCRMTEKESSAVAEATGNVSTRAKHAKRLEMQFAFPTVSVFNS